MSPDSPLRLARVKAGHTITTAGALINKTPSHYAKLERGEVTLTAADALRLARAFGVTIEAILSPLDTVSEST
jgi:transcriptional regulator with XRE-family HTH domain